MADRPSEPTPEELLEAVRSMKVSDLLLSTAATLAQLGFAKLDEPTRDLDQARLAVEGMKALLGALEGAVPAETLRDFNHVVANLQLAYAKAASAAPKEHAASTGDETPKEAEPES